MSSGVHLVTGGAGGLGALLVESLLRLNHRVCLLDLEEPALEPRENLLTLRADVSSSAEMREAMTVLSEWGTLQSAYNLAATCPAAAPCDAVAPEVWRRTIDTNLKGAWLCLKHQIPRLLGVKGAAILNFSSMLHERVLPGQAPYAASKRALLELTRSAAREAPGVRINALCPGLVRSPMTERLLAGSGAPDLTMARASSAKEVVSVALWLNSRAALGVTGQAIEVGRDLRHV